MSGRFWVGLLFLVLGLGFLLQQANVLDFSNVLSTWWPLIFIIIGIIQFINRNTISLVSSFLFIIVGSLLLINQWVAFNLTDYIWPLILIFIGLVFIFLRVNREKAVDSNEEINTFLLFSGTEIKSKAKCFKGGSITAVFGGTEIDLREATFSDKGATLDLVTVFGGASILVPKNVHVEVSGIPIFGGWEDKTRSSVDNDEILPVLKVKCLAIFGGVEINN